MVKNLPAHAVEPGSIPGLGRLPGGGKGQPIPVFLSVGESHAQRSLAGHSPWNCKRDTAERLNRHKYQYLGFC